MALELETLVTRYEADTRGFERGQREVQRMLRETDRAADRASRGFERSFSGFGRTFSSARSQIGAFATGIFNMRNAVVGLGGVLAVREVADYADAWTLAGDRLRLATRPHEDLEERMNSLFQTAQNTRVAFGTIADLYARVERSTRTLGLSTQELTDFTEGLAQTIRISGASAQEGANALIQFGQGLASGRLQGEELRSVMENLPTLMDALIEGLQETAPELNVTRENIRQLAADGALSSEQLARAFLSQLPRINREFATTSVTISEAVTRVSNAFGRLIGLQSEATGAASGVADALSDLARVLESEGFRSGFDDMVQGIRLAIGVVGDITTVVQALDSQIREFPGIAGLFDFDVPGVAGRLEVLNTILEKVGEFTTAVDEASTTLKFRIGVELDEGDLRGLIERLEREIQTQQQNLGQIQLGGPGVDPGQAGAIEAKIEELEAARTALEGQLQERVAEAGQPERVAEIQRELEEINGLIAQNERELGALLQDGVERAEGVAVQELEAKIAELREQADRLRAAAQDVGAVDTTQIVRAGGEGELPEVEGDAATRADFAQRFQELSAAITEMQTNLANTLEQTGEEVDQQAIGMIRAQIAELRAERELLQRGLADAIGGRQAADPMAEQARADLAQLNAAVTEAVEERNRLLTGTTEEVSESTIQAAQAKIDELTALRDSMSEALGAGGVSPTPSTPVPQLRGTIPPAIAAGETVTQRARELLLQARVEGLDEVEREVEEFKRKLEESGVDVGTVDLEPVRQAAAELQRAREGTEPDSSAVENYLTQLREEVTLLQASASARGPLEAMIRAEAAAQQEKRSLTADEVAEVERLAAARRDLAAAQGLDTVTQAIEDEIRLLQAARGEREAMRAVIQAENIAKQAGVELTAAEREEVERLVAARQAATVHADIAVTVARGLEQATAELTALQAIEGQRGAILRLVEAENAAKAAGTAVTLEELARIEEVAAREELTRVTRERGDTFGPLEGSRVIPADNDLEKAIRARMAALEEEQDRWIRLGDTIDSSISRGVTSLLTFQRGLDEIGDVAVETGQRIAEAFVQTGIDQLVAGLGQSIISGFMRAPVGGTSMGVTGYTTMPGGPLGGGFGSPSAHPFVFAEGGTFTGGQTLRVGEREPEWLVAFKGGGGRVIPGATPFARGGDFVGGQVLRVGESGPETVFTLPGGGGFVLPYATGAGIPFQQGGSFGAPLPPDLLRPAEVVLPPDLAREIAQATKEGLKARDGAEGRGGGTVVNIHDQRQSGGEPIRTETRRGPGGQEIVDVMVMDSLHRAARSGEIDPIFARFGGRRQPDG